ncbi:LacI family DNA-binding transcriptional regulator [Sulfitobacter mediterraneus]|uniref:LacI family DNA-binding transcriptional regulator n=1 Tax=Sulfitobacter mediterraneus TaxID=83219 RepID=UPI0013C44546|nr:LacI family DNA-binding transcriptional regulator [Sulfitobacter mediterraneus]
MSNRVTIKSIARDLGISHMTVSRALSDHPNVRPDTRKAVQDHARKVGYVKNAAAKAMRGDGTKIVGLLLPNIVNEFYARFANTLAQSCEDHSLHLIIHLTNDDPETELRAFERLHEVQAMSVIHVPAPGAVRNVSAHLNGVNVIQLIREQDMGQPASSILVEDHRAIGEAVQHLAGLGHRSIGYIGADERLSSGRARRAAFEAGLASAGLASDERLITLGAPDFSTGQRNAARLLEAGNVTAIVCGGFEISNGALSVFLEADQGAVEGAGFVGYGDPSYYAWLGGGVSTIAMQVDELAQEAARLAACRPEEQPVTRRSFEASFVARNTHLAPMRGGG